MNNTIVKASGIKKSYNDGESKVNVLKGINLEIASGDRIAIVGPSGSGKSTFLHLLGGLDKPSEGEVLFQGNDWYNLSEKKRCRLRNINLGFIYQFHHLLPEFSALDNVTIPLALAGFALDKAEEKAKDILNIVGLQDRLTHKPAELSGGERQRVAIARALVHSPKCVFADEPTGNLDNTTATLVFDLMLSLNKNKNTSLVIVTHDLSLANKMDKVYTLADGQLNS